MKEQEIEKQLKESANKISVKSFASRWDNVKDRLNVRESGLPCDVQVREAVAVSPGTNKTSNFKINKVLLIIIACSLALLIGLGITLAVILGNLNDKRYFKLNELAISIVTEDVFYKRVQKSGMELIDFSDYEVNSFSLLVADNYAVKGGRLEAYDEDLSFYLLITFYDSYVLSDFEIAANHNQLIVDNVNIAYKTEFKEGAYSTSALAKNKNVTYEIQYIYLEDNFEIIAKKLFV